MAVAAYASVLSLLRVVDNIQHPSYLRLFPDTTLQISALGENLCFLQEFLEAHSSTPITEDIECMVRKIPRVTYDAEILIDNYVVDQLYRELYPQNDVVGCCDIDSIHNEIHRVIQEIAPIKDASKTLRTIQRDQENPARVLYRFTGDKPLKNKVVGFDDQLKQVLDKLTRNQPNLVIVPIVGMGGIGKTTLARKAFDHPYNLHHFHVRIWLTISQDYSVKRVLQGLLKDGVLGDKKDSERDESESELIKQLHQRLFGQKYLIVLDDVWSLESWYDLKQGFPDNGKGSRVMITTRLSDIANSLDSRNNSCSMKFLDEDKSWDLLSEKAFEKGGRSLELEEIGRKISKRCKGLPLLLVLIGGQLANSNMTVDYWQTVAKDINSFDNSANDEYCSRILSLSYHDLPIHLKPCFLYTRHFKEDSDIKVSELVKKWVAQGFVKPMRDKTLEEAAKIYAEDLVGRNMFLIRERCENGNIISCGIHDLLRDLSIKESNKEQLLELPKTISVRRRYDEDQCKQCDICSKREAFMTTFNSAILGSLSECKILACSSCENTFPEFARSRFVKAAEFLLYSEQNVPVPTTCRWFSLNLPRTDVSIFHTIRLIWNLEILDIRGDDVDLPKELWDMPQLRHVKVWRFRLPDPVSTKNDVIVLENLQTLKYIKKFKCTEEIVRRIPNLRKLSVFYERLTRDGEEEEDWSYYYLQNLSHLQKLESLYIFCFRMGTLDLKAFAFPWSLKKLTLQGCKISGDDLTIMGLLPNLQVLQLTFSDIGEEWNPIEGEFLRLKYLKLRLGNLVHWGVDHETHFPALETLVIVCMQALEIPREIGELPSLNLIYLKWCHGNIINSAKVISEEQLSYGNERLVVRVEN